MTRFNVLVATHHENDRPLHIHVRNVGIRPAKVERIFADTVKDEYERLARGLNGDPDATIDVRGNLAVMDITGVLRTSSGSVTVSRIYVEEV